MTQQEIRSALFHNSRIRTMEGVALGTQLAYDPGWKSYVGFMNDIMPIIPVAMLNVNFNVNRKFFF